MNTRFSQAMRGYNSPKEQKQDEKSTERYPRTAQP